MEKKNKKLKKTYNDFINSGINDVKIGNLEEAKNNFLEAIKLDEIKYEAYVSLSNIYVINKNYTKSTKILFNYIDKYNYQKDLVDHLAKICFNFKLHDELEKLFVFFKLSSHKHIKDFDFLYLVQGQYYEKKSKFNLAISAYKKSIFINNQNINVYVKLLSLLETTNKINNFKEFIDYGYKHLVTKKSITFINFFESLYLNRVKEYSLSHNFIKKNHLKKIFKNNTDFYLKILNLEINNLEKLGKYSDSFFNMLKKNEIIKNLSKNQKFDKNEIINTILKYKKFYIKKNVNYIKQNNKHTDDSNLIFLVGFPRSGTTLLDTILRTHSNINVLEENPVLINLRNDFFKKNNNQLTSLLNISQKEKDLIRNQYYKEVKKTINVKKNVLIDKLPLSIIEIGFIKCIFPNSKIVLALRHPCDTVLSCFSNSFTINEAMVNFLSLDNTINLYNTVFDLFEFYEKELQLNYFKIKYEDVVYDFETQITKLLNFLELKYENKIKDFYLTAQKREKIATPSYSQVINPLYTSSIGRWQNFKEIKDSRSKLEKWIKKFNY